MLADCNSVTRSSCDISLAFNTLVIVTELLEKLSSSCWDNVSKLGFCYILIYRHQPLLVPGLNAKNTRGPLASGVTNGDAIRHILDFRFVGYVIQCKLYGLALQVTRPLKRSAQLMAIEPTLLRSRGV